MTDLPPLRAAVKLAQQLTKASDERSRRCLVRLLNRIHANMKPGDEGDPVSKYGRRILKVMGDQRLQAKAIARLCGLQYAGRFRGEMAKLVEAKVIEKVGVCYVKKCPTSSGHAKEPILTTVEKH